MPAAVESLNECPQCGFLEANHTSYYRSGEWVVSCTRCGYYESWEHESYFSHGHLRKGINKVVYSAGAYCVKDPKTGVELHGGLSEGEVEEAATRMRDDIASGKVSPRSYVTKYDFKSREVTALVGRVPLGSPFSVRQEEAIEERRQQEGTGDTTCPPR